jgi:hypothetical protein
VIILLDWQGKSLLQGPDQEMDLKMPSVTGIKLPAFYQKIIDADAAFYGYVCPSYIESLFPLLFAVFSTSILNPNIFIPALYEIPAY